MRCEPGFVIALVVVATACGNNKESASSAATGSGSSSAAATDPWSKPAAPHADAPCNDTDIKKHIDDSLAASMAYLKRLENKTATWTSDCEAATKDLLALEPDAQKFMDAMLAFKAWGEKLGDTCRARVAELGDQAPQTAEIDKHTPALEARVTPMLERCKDHPGFQNAAGKGLRVMKRHKT